MKTLQITEQTAQEIYSTASVEFKKILEDTFGKKFFLRNITDRVKSYEDACVKLNQEPINEALFRDSGFTEDEIIYRKIKTIIEALNEGWKPNWEDGSQKKWQPWFRVSPSGFVFCDTYYDCSYALAGYASRLCFKSSELAEYAGKQFIDLYKQFIL